MHAQSKYLLKSLTNKSKECKQIGRLHAEAVVPRLHLPFKGCYLLKMCTEFLIWIYPVALPATASSFSVIQKAFCSWKSFPSVGIYGLQATSLLILWWIKHVSQYKVGFSKLQVHHGNVHSLVMMTTEAATLLYQWFHYAEIKYPLWVYLLFPPVWKKKSRLLD